MKNIHIRKVDDDTYLAVKVIAAAQNMSLVCLNFTAHFVT